MHKKGGIRSHLILILLEARFKFKFKLMDMISSYPSGLLEADARAGSYRAPCAQSPERPSDWRLRESHGPKLLGPIAHSLGKPNMIGAILYCGPAIWPKLAVLEQFQKLHRFSNNCAVFPKQNCAVFPTLGNFQNYPFN